jgi:hypothetical protein
MKKTKVITIGDEDYVLSDVFLSQILETAVEGACSYWADIDAEHRGGEEGRRDYDVSDYLEGEQDDDDDEDEAAASDDALFYTSASFLVSKDPAQGGTLDLESIADAIERIANQEVEIAPAVREIIIAAIEEEDASEVDAEAADCIVQIGLFDEIVYS